MSKSSGSTRRNTPNDATYSGKVENVESLKTMKNEALYREMKHAISRFESVLGVRQQNVKLADLDGAYGVHVTSGGASEGVYLNKKIFQPESATVQKVASERRSDYRSKWSTETNKPAVHTVTHELAHALWNSHLTSPKAVQASTEVKSLYWSWLRDKSKKGYGKYAASNVNEFFAETATKAVHGKSDYYTDSIKRIIKKYNL